MAISVFILLTLLVWCWLLTDGGTWNFMHPEMHGFLHPEMHGKYYDELGTSLLQGRWEVPCAAIGEEALIKDGKCYGYFGPTPALLRIPLNLLLPEMAGYWSRVSVLLALFFNLIFSLLILARLWRLGNAPCRWLPWASAMLILFAGSGGTAVFLTSPAFIYHEAIAWGGALAMGAYLFMIRYLERGETRSLIGGWLLGGLALHARINVGYGAVLALLIITTGVGLSPYAAKWSRLAGVLAFWGIPAPQADRFQPRVARLMLVLTLLLALTPFGISLLKFGEPALFPLKYHNALVNDPQRAAVTRGSFVQSANLLFATHHYFNPASLRPSPLFPYFQMGPPHWDPDYLPGLKLDRGEPMVSLTNTIPALMVLSLLGLGGVFNSGTGLTPLRIPLLGACAGGGTVLLVAGLTHRYTHDFQAFFVIAGAAGLCRLARLPQLRWRRLVAIALTLLAVAGVYVNTGTALLSYFADPGIRNRLAQIRQTLDGPPQTLDLLQLYTGNVMNGVSTLPNHHAVIIRTPYPAALRPGTVVIFPHSGNRRVEKVMWNGIFHIVQVDAPIDPLRDGIPHQVGIYGQ